jgi:hypothetical protein
VSWRLVSAHATTSDPRFETQAAIAASIAVHNEVKRAGWSTVEAGAPVALFLTRSASRDSTCGSSTCRPPTANGF